jgi:predicted dehydrogenase
MTSNSSNRRHFLKRSVQGAAALAGAWAVPSLIPSSALGFDGAVAPSERIRLGLIGCGGHGVNWNLRMAFRCPEVQVVAVCDVDSEHLAWGQKTVDENYRPIYGDAYKPCEGYSDFRKLVLRKDIDAVCNATPDHWHAIPTIMALRCDKDVISEKPLTLFVDEGKVMCQAVAEHKRIFQTASENRSIDTYIRLTELVRGGVIGKLTHIDVSVPLGNTDMRVSAEAKSVFNRREVEPIPPQLDYPMWLGQAPLMPYIPARVHGNFRWNLAFSGGVLTDWGAHMIDLAQWGHDTEHTGPVEVDGTGEFPPRDAVFNTTPTFSLHYKYADGVTMDVSAKSPLIRFEGTNGWIECKGWRGSLKASERPMLDVVIDPEKVKVYRPSEIEDRKAGKLGGEHRNFYDCMKTRQPCYAPAEIGHRSITIAHIGNIAMMLGRKLQWDPQKENFVGDAEASAMLTREQREPWTLANINKWI